MSEPPEVSASSVPSARSAVWAIVAIVALALALRLFRLEGQSLWVDEAVTWRGAHLPMRDLLRLTSAYAMAHSLYYAIVHGMVALFGDGESVLRAPSVVFGAASIPLLYLIGRDWFGHRVGLVAAVLLAVSPIHLYYSQEARPYAAVVFFVLGAMVSLDRALEGRRRRGWQAGFVVSFTAMLFCHPIALGFLPALAVRFLRGRGRPSVVRLRPALIGAMAAILALSMVLTAYPPLRRTPVESRGIAVLPYTAWAFSTGYSLGPSVRELHAPAPMRVALQHAPLIVAVLLLTGGLALRGVLRVARESPGQLAVILSWLVGPVVFIAVGTAATGHAYNVRYVIPALPAFLLLVALGIEGVSGLRRRAAVGAAVLAICAVSVSNYFTSPVYARDDYRSAAHALAARARPGELVLVSEAYTRIMLDYYDPGPVRVVPFPFPHTQGNWERAKADLDRVTEARERFWLFLGRPDPDRLGTRIPAYLDRRFVREVALEWPGTRLLRYGAVPGSGSRRRAGNIPGPDE